MVRSNVLQTRSDYLLQDKTNLESVAPNSFILGDNEFFINEQLRIRHVAGHASKYRLLESIIHNFDT